MATRAALAMTPGAGSTLRGPVGSCSASCESAAEACRGTRVTACVLTSIDHGKGRRTRWTGVISTLIVVATACAPAGAPSGARSCAARHTRSRAPSSIARRLASRAGVGQAIDPVHLNPGCRADISPVPGWRRQSRMITRSCSAAVRRQGVAIGRDTLGATKPGGRCGRVARSRRPPLALRRGRSWCFMASRLRRGARRGDRTDRRLSATYPACAFGSR